MKEVNCSKDLGIKFYSNGGFKKHIKEKVAKCKQICGYILTFYGKERTNAYAFEDPCHTYH